MSKSPLETVQVSLLPIFLQETINTLVNGAISSLEIFGIKNAIAKVLLTLLLPTRPPHNMYQMNYIGMGSALPVCYEKLFSKMSNSVNFLSKP